MNVLCFDLLITINVLQSAAALLQQLCAAGLLAMHLPCICHASAMHLPCTDGSGMSLHTILHSMFDGDPHDRFAS